MLTINIVVRGGPRISTIRGYVILRVTELRIRVNLRHELNYRDKYTFEFVSEGAKELAFEIVIL